MIQASGNALCVMCAVFLYLLIITTLHACTYVVAAVVLTTMLRFLSFVCTALQLLLQRQCVSIFGSAMHKHAKTW